MKRYGSGLLFIVISIAVSGCSAGYMGSGLNDLHRSAGILDKSLEGVITEIISRDMELRAEKSAARTSIQVSDLEPASLAFAHLNLRRELTGCLAEYTGLLKAFFERDHSASAADYGKALRESLDQIRSDYPALISNEAGSLIASVISAVPEGLTFTRKRKYALKLMAAMQDVIGKVTVKLTEEVTSLRILAPNLYARLFREKVEKKWPDNEEKRVKSALTGVKIIKQREKFIALADDLINVLEILPSAHRKLMDAFRKNGGRLTGLTDLMTVSLRLAGNLAVFSKGNEQ